MSKSKAPRRAGQVMAPSDPASGLPPEQAPASGSPDSLTITLDRRSLPYLLGGALIALGMLAWAMGWLRLPDTPVVDPGSSLWLVVLTGFLAGGLSCLAVQGGLLAATIAQREQSLLEREARLTDHAMPVVVFLFAKLAAYTLLGALLGYLGSFLSLSPTLRGLLQVAIGLFMIIVALQLLDVHPFFRRFALTPPKSVQRQIRKQSKRSDALGPAILGALTVFIPCGVTQAMELVAMASGDPLRGAAIMFAFTLGTMPLFFVLGLAATRISAVWQKGFRYVSVAVILTLAVVSIVGGLRLTGRLAGGTTTAGNPAAPTAAAASQPDPATPAPTPGPVAGAPEPAAGVQEAVIEAVNSGYVPTSLSIKAGTPTRLKLVTNDVHSCARAFTIPALGVERILPATGTEYVDIPPQQPGRLAFVCSMGMYGGTIEVLP